MGRWYDEITADSEPTWIWYLSVSENEAGTLSTPMHCQFHWENEGFNICRYGWRHAMKFIPQNRWSFAEWWPCSDLGTKAIFSQRSATDRIFGLDVESTRPQQKHAPHKAERHQGAVCRQPTGYMMESAAMFRHRELYVGNLQATWLEHSGRKQPSSGIRELYVGWPANHENFSLRLWTPNIWRRSDTRHRPRNCLRSRCPLPPGRGRDCAWPPSLAALPSL